MENTTINHSDKKDPVIPDPATPKVTLEALLSKITPENIHSEIDFGDDIGNEKWQ